MKILHTADLHLDRAFEGLGKIPAALSEKLAKANQNVLRKIIDTALAENVDLMLIAGDTFHQERMSIQVQSFFVNQLQRLKEAQISVVMIFGNHDFVQPDRFWFSLPDHVTVLEKERVETVVLTTKNQEKVAVSGFSYHHPHISKNMLLEFPARYSEVDFHIGLYHGAISQAEKHQFAPFQLSEMKEKRYDYWALGHIHKPEILVQPYPLIAYSGAPQGHTRKERESNSILLVELSKQGNRAKQVICSEVNWQSLSVDVTNRQKLDEWFPTIEAQILQQTSLQKSQIQLVQLKVTHTQGDFDIELAQKMASGEFLYHLQERLYQKTDGKIWIYDLQLEQTEDDWILPFGLNRELLEQLTAKYTKKEEFAKVISPLMQQKDLSRSLHFDSEQQAMIAEDALQELLQKMGIQREDR